MGEKKEELIPFLVMVLLQFLLAGLNITCKLAIDSGLKPLVLVAYRQIFATLVCLPLSYLSEWKSLPKLTKPLLFQIFLCSLTGITLNQVLYFVGLHNSSATVACAIANVLPAATFILAVSFRQENVGIRTLPGQAKVAGTTACVAGAILLSIYHGKTINLPQPQLHWELADSIERHSTATGTNHPAGALFIVGSAVSCAIWFTLQAKVSKHFPAPNTCTLLMSFMSSIECTAIAAAAHHHVTDWSLRSANRLIATLYSGVVGTAVTYSLMSWAIQKKGALYVAVFNPLVLVVVAVVSWAFLREKVTVGMLTGSMLIILGLYLVLWGKQRETKMNSAVGSCTGGEDGECKDKGSCSLTGEFP